jgi:hypothetical protein
MPSQLDLHCAERLLRCFLSADRGRRLRQFPHELLWLSLLFCVICTSCGAVGTAPPAPSPVTVTVTANSPNAYQGETDQFTATVQNAASAAVTWQVNGMDQGSPSFGTINTSGLYTAPIVVPSQPTVTVTAVLQSDSTKTGSSSVTILSLSSITGPLVVSPALSSLTTSQTLQLQVLTPGVSNSDVSWAVDGGIISPTGIYSPPSVPGGYTVKASLIANPNAVGTAQVEVTDFPGTFTWRNDNARSGVNSKELALAPSTVNSSTFGKLFSCSIDGYAYAQPLYFSNLAIPGKGTHNVIFVATEKDSVFAFDADANLNPCVPLWKTSLIPDDESQAIAFPNLVMTGTDIVPFVGITGTPVIDPSASALYVVASTQTIAINPTYSQHLYALDLATGSKIQPAGVEIASPSPQPSTFIAVLESQQPALLLADGTIYIGFGSYGGQCVGEPDCPYHGWLFGYNSASLQQTGVFNVTPTGLQGGILQSGGGPSADSNGNIFVTTGEGPFGPSPGGMNYSDSFLRLGTAGGLSVSDSFTPCEQGTLDTPGQDVSASAPVLLLGSQPNLLIGGSKNGSLYVVNPDNMGGFNSGCSDDAPPRVQSVSVGAGATIFSTPLFWNNAVYVAPGKGNLMSFPMMSQGVLNATPSPSKSPELLGPEGATPVISWNASSKQVSSAILWLIDSSGALTGEPAILRAFDPNNLSNEIYSSPTALSSPGAAGPAVKFTVPTVANGKVYVGTQTKVDVFGLLP